MSLGYREFHQKSYSVLMNSESLAVQRVWKRTGRALWKFKYHFPWLAPKVTMLKGFVSVT